MKKSVKRIVSFVSAIAMLSTTAMAVSAATEKVTLQETNAVKVASAEEMAATTSDVVVITTATDKIEAAALEILKVTFDAKAATKEAIAEAVKTMSSDQISAAVDKAVNDEKNTEAMTKAVDEAAADIEKIINGARNNKNISSIVISDVYNPLNGVAGGEVVKAAQKAIQKQVDDAQEKIQKAIDNQVDAVSNKIVVAPVEAAKVDLNAIKVGGAAAAEAVTKTFDAQEANKVDAVNAAEVKGEKVDFKYGDLNNDGVIKAVDLVIALQYQLGILTEKECENLGYKIAAADVNKDQKIASTADLSMMKLYLLGDLEESELGKMAL